MWYIPVGSRKQWLSREYISGAYFIFGTASSLDGGVNDLEGIADEHSVREGNRHPGEVETDIKSDGQVRDA